MPQTAEVLAHQFNITCEAMDVYALRSHQRLAAAQENKYLKEIVPLFTDEGKFYDRDDGIRSDTSLKKLAQLKPIFDRKFEEVTVGNSSQVTDGASLVIVASEREL